MNNDCFNYSLCHKKILNELEIHLYVYYRNTTKFDRLYHTLRFNGTTYLGTHFNQEFLKLDFIKYLFKNKIIRLFYYDKKTQMILLQLTNKSLIELL